MFIFTVYIVHPMKVALCDKDRVEKIGMSCIVLYGKCHFIVVDPHDPLDRFRFSLISCLKNVTANDHSNRLEYIVNKVFVKPASESK